MEEQISIQSFLLIRDRLQRLKELGVAGVNYTSNGVEYVIHNKNLSGYYPVVRLTDDFIIVYWYQDGTQQSHKVITYSSFMELMEEIST